MRSGDILSIDCGAVVDGCDGDAAVTVPVGQVDDGAERLMKVTSEALTAAIAAAVPGARGRWRRGRHALRRLGDRHRGRQPRRAFEHTIAVTADGPRILTLR